MSFVKDDNGFLRARANTAPSGHDQVLSGKMIARNFDWVNGNPPGMRGNDSVIFPNRKKVTVIA
jgi:hypothetical protein